VDQQDEIDLIEQGMNRHAEENDEEGFNNWVIASLTDEE
jgi:hypothetical protein